MLVVTGPTSPESVSDHTYSAIQSTERVTRFHDQVKRIAILMCEEMELDPFEHISRPPGGNLTPWEERNVQYGKPSTYSSTNTSDVSYVIRVQRWEMFRRHAAIALAGWRAVNKYVMCEM